MIVLNDGTLHEFRKAFVPNIETIAHALAYINRFTGHVGQYSVAQHCVLIAMKLPQELKLAGLLHDAPEAYLGDVSAPLKRLLPDYKKLEAFYHKAIDDHFGVETEHPMIKEYDVRMLVAEGLHFDMPIEHFPNAEPLYLDIKVWEPECAKEAFLSMYYNLTGEARPAAKSEVKFISPVFSSDPAVEKAWCKVDFDNVTQQVESLAGKDDDRYYCICDNKHCGSWYELGKEGETCSECGSGKLHPQDVEPWE